ncbi:MAG: hypothetical protein OK449_10065 [Thaumarchaeota archaeon]|nr:hypothetical protein [Nitrososphaerota archaeon]
MIDLLLVLATAAAIIDGLLAGAVLDYAVKQLPARKSIGIVAYGRYFKASDFANGRFWYVPLGLSAYALNVLVAILAYSQNGMSSSTILFALAAGCAVVHAFGTSQAVPAGLGFLRLEDGTEAILNKSFDRFAKWVVVRAIFGAPMFVAVLFGLVMLS